MRKLFRCFFFLFILFAAVGLWGYQQLQQFAEQQVNAAPDQLITIVRGTGSKKLAEQLEREHIISNAALLPWLLKLHPEFGNVKAGTYSLNGVTTLSQLLILFNEGKEAQLALRFTEGETFKQIIKSLENAPHLQHTLQDKSEAEIFELLDLPKIKTLQEQKKVEGWIYPDTYHYTPNSTDFALLKRAVERMQKALEHAWQQREDNLPLNNSYEMLILASIVEKETGIATERNKVASVFINRLNAKMKLQTDPTVIYGMGDDYKGNIRKKDLEQPTSYNTYVIDGLPPTPIATVSEASLNAVAKPEKTDFFYFVADGSGGHKFSKTLSEHNRAVQEYLRWYRNNQKDK